MNANWFIDILRMFFTFLDSIVYGLISVLYELFMYLANLDLFGMSEITASTAPSENIIINFSSRIYALLGVFMLFKISFSLLQYMVNPDDFSDKGKGFGKMVTNILVSLVLIVTVPYIFQKAFEIQGVILKTNFLGSLILGNTNSENNPSSTTNKEMATDLQFLVYGTFFSVDKDANGGEVCENSPILGTKAMAQSEECLTYVSNAINNEHKLGDFFNTDEPDNRRFAAFGEVVNTTDSDGKYVFNYMPLISTIVGGFVVVMLLSFCMDLAVRTIKLGFLEIISPIPIISYMDPKQSGKDGMLGKWAKECGSTFLSLFIRMAIIYFTFFIVDLVANNIFARPDEVYLEGVTPPSGLMAAFVQLMIILGVFLFAKEVPKLLESIMGIKNSASLRLDTMKSIGLGSAAIAGAAAGGLTANVMSRVSDYKKIKDENPEMSKTDKLKYWGRSVGSAVGGGVSAATRAGIANIRGKGKSPVKAMQQGIDASNLARNNRATRNKAGYTSRQRAIDWAMQRAGIKNKAGGVGAMDQQVKEWTRDMDNAEIQERAMRHEQATWVGTNSNHRFSEFQQAMFEPKYDQNGKVLRNDDGDIIYDETNIRTYNDYLNSLEPGDQAISQNEYEKFKQMQEDINKFDQDRETYRKQIKNYQDVMDTKNKKE